MAEQTANTETLSDIVGKHIIYVYENSWRYEIYAKNSSVIDYRIHSGMVTGRWVRGRQRIVSDCENRCFAVFLRRVKDNPQKTVCFQNAHLADTRHYSDEDSVCPFC